MNKIIKYSLLLAAICAISALLLAVVNSFAGPIIEEAKQAKLKAELEAQFPYAYYSRADNAANDKKDNDIQAYFYAFNEDKEVQAVIYRTSYQGYKSQIICLISIKVDGKIENVKMVDGNDTYDSDIKKHDFGVAGAPITDYDYVILAGVTKTSDAVGRGLDSAVAHFKTIQNDLGKVRYE